MPLCITLVIIGEHFVVDATLEEEVCMKARVSVAVNSDGKYCGVEKGGKGGVDPSKLCEVLHVRSLLRMRPLQGEDNGYGDELCFCVRMGGGCVQLFTVMKMQKIILMFAPGCAKAWQ